MIDTSVSPGPTLPSGHPFTGVQSVHYWSASTYQEFSIFAWQVDFSNGLVVDDNKTDPNHVWCVRGGNNADAY